MNALTSRQLGVTTWTLPERGAAGLSWAREAGFGHVHIDARDVAVEGLDALRVAAADLDIRLAGVAAITLEEIGIEGQDAVACVSDAIDMCTNLGIRYLYLPSFEAATISDESDLMRTAVLLRHAIGSARPRGIAIATENTLRVDELPRLFAAVGSPELELLFDTQNPSRLSQSAPDIARSMRARIRSFVHVKDGVDSLGDRRIGDGVARVAESLGIMRRGGFDGSFVIESDYRSGEVALAREDQERLISIIAGARSGNAEHMS